MNSTSFSLSCFSSLKKSQSRNRSHSWSTKVPRILIYSLSEAIGESFFVTSCASWTNEAPLSFMLLLQGRPRTWGFSPTYKISEWFEQKENHENCSHTPPLNAICQAKSTFIAPDFSVNYIFTGHWLSYNSRVNRCHEKWNDPWAKICGVSREFFIC